MLVDNLVQFGEGLGIEAIDLEKLWNTVLGRYHRAVKSLVLFTLQASQFAVEQLAHAISQMTPESARTAALAVKKGSVL